MPFSNRSRGLSTRALDRLPSPSAPKDELIWAWALLPPGDQQGDRPAQIAGLLRKTPQLGFDQELSLPLLYNTGGISFEKMLETSLAPPKGASGGGQQNADVKAEMRAALGAECLRRAQAPRAPTDIKCLPSSRTAEAMKLRGRRRDQTRSDSSRLGKELEDNQPRAHRRRINRRHDQTVAIVDMACGKVGDPASGKGVKLGAEPIASRRVVERFCAKRSAFREGAGSIALALVDADDGTRRPKKLTIGGVLDRRVMRKILDHYGLEEAIRRTVIWTDAAAFGAADDHRWERAKVEALRQIWVADRERLRAFTVTLKLRGGFQDLTHPFPCTPNDCALLLRDIAHAALKDLRCAAVGTVDASQRGWPHIHLNVVVHRDDADSLRSQLRDAYRRRGMRWQGGRDQLCAFSEVTSDGRMPWHYGVDKTEPSLIASSYDHFLSAHKAPGGDQAGRIVSATRLAAWHHVHGIGRTFDANIEWVTQAKALAQVSPGSHSWVDGIAEAASPGTRDLSTVEARARILIAIGFVPKLAEPKADHAWRVGRVVSTQRMEAVDMTLEMTADDVAVKRLTDASGNVVDAAADARFVWLHFQNRPFEVIEWKAARGGRCCRMLIRQSRAIRRFFSDVNLTVIPADGSQPSATIVARAARQAVPLAAGLSIDEVRDVYRQLV